jgi:hypothetical protein
MDIVSVKCIEFSKVTILLIYSIFITSMLTLIFISCVFIFTCIHFLYFIGSDLQNNIRDNSKYPNLMLNSIPTVLSWLKVVRCLSIYFLYRGTKEDYSVALCPRVVGNIILQDIFMTSWSNHKMLPEIHHCLFFP